METRVYNISIAELQHIIITNLLLVVNESDTNCNLPHYDCVQLIPTKWETIVWVESTK